MGALRQFQKTFPFVALRTSFSIRKVTEVCEDQKRKWHNAELNFSDTSLRALGESFVVLTNCHWRFSFFTQDCSGDIDRPLAMPPRQPTDLPSPSPQESSHGRPILVQIPTSQPSPHPSLAAAPFCAGGVGQSRAWSADNGPTGAHRCPCFSHLIQLILSVSATERTFWDVSRS